MPRVVLPASVRVAGGKATGQGMGYGKRLVSDFGPAEDIEEGFDFFGRVRGVKHRDVTWFIR